MNDTHSEQGGMLNWRRVAPAIDEAIDKLGKDDRAAVLLRYIENRPFAEIGRALRLSEDAARMRVDRALDRLRVTLKRRGIESTAGALGVALSSEAVHAAPAALASGVTEASMAVPIAAAASASGLIELMTITKTGVGIVSGVLLLSVGSGIYEYRSHAAAKADLASAVAETKQMHAELSSAERDRTEIRRQAAELERQLKERKHGTASRPVQAATAPGPVDKKDPVTVGAAFLAAHPAVKEALVRFVDSQTDSNFGALYRELQMTSAEIERFRTLMREVSGYSQYLGQTSQLVQFSLGSGLDRREAWDGVRDLLGEVRFRRLMEFQSELPVRQLTESMAGAFVFSEPLTMDQIRQMQQVVRESRIKTEFNLFDWQMLVTQAAGFLTSQQIEVLNGVRAQKEYNQSVMRAAADRQAGAN